MKPEDATTQPADEGRLQRGVMALVPERAVLDELRQAADAKWRGNPAAQQCGLFARAAAEMERVIARVQELEATEEGAQEAFGAVVQEKRDLEAECRRLRELLDHAYAQLRIKR